MGLAVDLAELKFCAIVCDEAALCVDREEVLVAQLDVVVIEVVDLLVGRVGVEAVALGVEGVSEQLPD